MSSRPAVAVAWVGPQPSWVDEVAATKAFGEITFVDMADADVVHLAAERTSTPSIGGGTAVVAEVTSSPDGDSLDVLRLADVVVVRSNNDAQALARRVPELREKTRVIPTPLDLALHAPDQDLLKSEGPRFKRFRRFHRLGTPAFLYVGPYTPQGGLDTAVEAAFLLREQFPEVRLISIPDGEIDRKFLDACEMRALGLGHRGIIEWTADASELAFWHAVASVVTVPVRELDTLPPALHRAAAAGRPFVGSDLGVLRLEAGGLDWVSLVPPDDPVALAAACAELFADAERAAAEGRSARAWAETTLSDEAAFARLADLWLRSAKQNVESRQVA